MDSLERDKLPGWTNIWPQIDTAVTEEANRTKIASKFIQPQLHPGVANVPADTLVRNGNGKATDTGKYLSIEEGISTPLVEVSVRFALTGTQVSQLANGGDTSSLMTLVTCSANMAQQATEFLIFRGHDKELNKLFPEVKVTGTLATKGGLSAIATEEVVVEPVKNGNKGYGEKTFEAVARAYSKLAAEKADAGPFAVVLPAKAFADSLAPLSGTLVTPADRIKGLVSKDWFFGTGTLPESDGVFVSLGGHRINLFYGQEMITGYEKNDAGNYFFRVFQRFQLVVPDTDAIVRLHFKNGVK